MISAIDIQTGSNWWITGMARFPGAEYVQTYKAGIFTKPQSVGQDPLDESSSPASSLISDAQEEGETPSASDVVDTHASPALLTAEQLGSNSTEMGVSEQTITAAAMHIGVIEAAMRKHQTTGVVNFDDEGTEQSDQKEDPSDAAFPGSMLGDVLKNPFAALAAATPGRDRKGLFSMLAA